MGKLGTPDNPALVIGGELEHMFFGRYEHSIDEKGRMTIPARFREELGVGAFITRGFDPNLVVYTSSYFNNTISKKVDEMRNLDPQARSLRRFIYSNASPLEFDKVGRILIPQFLRDAVDIHENALVIGAGVYFEIWSPSAWEAQNAQLDPEKTVQQYSALDL